MSKVYNYLYLIFVFYCFFLTYGKIKQIYNPTHKEEVLVSQIKAEPKLEIKKEDKVTIPPEEKKEKYLADRDLYNSIEVTLNERNELEITFHQEQATQKVSELITKFNILDVNEVYSLESKLNSNLADLISSSQEKITSERLMSLQNQALQITIADIEKQKEENKDKLAISGYDQSSEPSKEMNLEQPAETDSLGSFINVDNKEKSDDGIINTSYEFDKKIADQLPAF